MIDKNHIIFYPELDYLTPNDTVLSRFISQNLSSSIYVNIDDDRKELKFYYCPNFNSELTKIAQEATMKVLPATLNNIPPDNVEQLCDLIKTDFYSQYYEHDPEYNPQWASEISKLLKENGYLGWKTIYLTSKNYITIPDEWMTEAIDFSVKHLQLDCQDEKLMQDLTINKLQEIIQSPVFTYQIYDKLINTLENEQLFNLIEFEHLGQNPLQFMIKVMGDVEKVDIKDLNIDNIKQYLIKEFNINDVMNIIMQLEFDNIINNMDMIKNHTFIHQHPKLN